jgi:hypothetical protein
VSESTEVRFAVSFHVALELPAETVSDESVSVPDCAIVWVIGPFSTRVEVSELVSEVLALEVTPPRFEVATSEPLVDA